MVYEDLRMLEREGEGLGGEREGDYLVSIRFGNLWYEL